MSLYLVKIKRSKNWYIRGSVGGIRIFETTETANKELAQRKLNKRETELFHASIYGEDSVITFGQAALQYLEAGGSAKYLGKYENGEWSGMIAELLDVRLKDITQAFLDQVALRVYPDVKPQTLNRQFYTPFVAVWNFAARNELCSFRRWSRPKVRRRDKKKTKWFRFAEAQQMYHALPAHMRPLFTFICLTGTRITEAIELEWSDVDLDGRWAVINATKTDSERGVPLHPAVIAELSAQESREGRVFRTHTGKPYKSKRAKDGTMRGGGYFKSSWGTALKKAGLEGFTPYSMRHTFNNWCVLMDISEDDRGAIMGHVSDSTNAIYTDVPQSRLIEMIQKLPDFREVHT